MKKCLIIMPLSLICVLLCSCSTFLCSSEITKDLKKETVSPESSEKVSDVTPAEVADADGEYTHVLEVYSAFLEGKLGLNGDLSCTVVPTPNTKYAIIDMNDDGTPEIATTTIIFQNRDPNTYELESSFFDCAIFSYENGEVFWWGGGNSRHHEFEILNNKALLYDYDDGSGIHEVIYEELDTNGSTAYRIYLYENRNTGHHYIGRNSFYDSDVEISEEEWHERVGMIRALRTDTISWVDYSVDPKIE